MTTWTPERVAELTRRRRAGESFTAIARALHVGKGAIAGKLHRLAGYKRPAVGRPREPDPTRVLAAAIVLDGGTYQEAMQETGLSWDQVRRAIMAAKNREWKELREAADASP